MFYIVYKTTNQVNGKFYIGTHKTVDLNDDYLGSGKYLKHAIEKYGVENFKKEILFVFDNTEDMFAKEAEIVTEDFISENNTYNLKKGGFGGFDYLNSREYNNPTHNKHHMSMMAEQRKKYYPRGVFFGKCHNDKTKEKISEHKKGQQTFLGKKHSDKTKKIIAMKNSEKQKGSKNSQYGTFWITDGKSNMKVKNMQDIPVGWVKGRIFEK